MFTTPYYEMYMNTIGYIRNKPLDFGIQDVKKKILEISDVTTI